MQEWKKPTCKWWFRNLILKIDGFKPQAQNFIANKGSKIRLRNVTYGREYNLTFRLKHYITNPSIKFKLMDRVAFPKSLINL